MSAYYSAAPQVQSSLLSMSPTSSSSSYASGTSFGAPPPPPPAPGMAGPPPAPMSASRGGYGGGYQPAVGHAQQHWHGKGCRSGDGSVTPAAAETALMGALSSRGASLSVDADAGDWSDRGTSVAHKSTRSRMAAAPSASRMANSAASRMVPTGRRVQSVGEGPAKEKKGPVDTLRALIEAQTFEGYWVLDNLLKLMGWDKQAVMDKWEGQHKDDRVVATALAVGWLRVYRKEQMDTWELVADKAVSWLDDLGVSGEEVVKTGEALVLKL